MILSRLLHGLVLPFSMTKHGTVILSLATAEHTPLPGSLTTSITVMMTREAFHHPHGRSASSGSLSVPSKPKRVTMPSLKAGRFIWEVNQWPPMPVPPLWTPAGTLTCWRARMSVEWEEGQESHSPSPGWAGPACSCLRDVFDWRRSAAGRGRWHRSFPGSSVVTTNKAVRFWASCF